MFLNLVLYAIHITSPTEACKCQPHKMVKHTQTIRVFDHFVGLALKGLRKCGMIF